MSLPFVNIDVPMYIGWCVFGTITSAVPVLAAAIKAVLGQLPNPNDAGAWSFYGVLIVAIVVLFGCMVTALRWFFGYWMREQKDMWSCLREVIKENSSSNLAVAEAVRKNTEVTSKQNEWFDQHARGSLERALTFPPKNTSKSHD